MVFRELDSGEIWRQLRWLLVLSALAAGTACSTRTNEPGFNESQTSQSPESTSTVTPGTRATRGRPDPPTPDLTLTTTPWDPNAPRPTQTPVPPPPALIYSDSGGLWWISPNWQPTLLIDQAGAELSPDGAKAFYQDGTDIWLIDTGKGFRRNLTENTGRYHCCASWWPARSGVLVLGSWPAGSELGPSTGYLTIIDSESGDYSVLDGEVPSNGDSAPGPDGQTIAYDRAGEAWLYHLDDEPERFDPADYGLPGIVRIGGPSWSPGGRHLAWTAAVEDPGWQIVLAVFDLASQSGRLIHPYETAGRGGWFPPPTWSPDGRYLAFAAEDINQDASGIWAVAADGSEEVYLGPGSKPSWSPDGRWLMYTGFDGVGEDRIPAAWLVEVASWYLIRMALPPDTIEIGWPP